MRQTSNETEESSGSTILCNGNKSSHNAEYSSINSISSMDIGNIINDKDSASADHFSKLLPASSISQHEDVELSDWSNDRSIVDKDEQLPANEKNDMKEDKIQNESAEGAKGKSNFSENGQDLMQSLQSMYTDTTTSLNGLQPNPNGDILNNNFEPWSSSHFNLFNNAMVSSASSQIIDRFSPFVHNMSNHINSTVSDNSRNDLPFELNTSKTNDEDNPNLKLSEEKLANDIQHHFSPLDHVMNSQNLFMQSLSHAPSLQNPNSYLNVFPMLSNIYDGFTDRDRVLWRNTCPYCYAVKAGPADLQRHMRKHTGERPFNCNVSAFSAISM